MFVAAHNPGMRHLTKEQSQPVRDIQDRNLKAHAIRKSDLLAASCDQSITSLCASSGERDSCHHRENTAGKARTKGKHHGGYVPAAIATGDRQPLHALNGPVSQTHSADPNLRADASWQPFNPSISACSDVYISILFLGLL